MKKLLGGLIAVICAGLAIVVLTAQAGYWGGFYVNGGASNGDYISVWASGSTMTAYCSLSPYNPISLTGCFFAVQQGGNLWFYGNNATYGTSGQSTQSFLKGYGSGGGTPNPFYVESLNGSSGSVEATLFASTTVAGEWCIGSVVPSSDCPSGSALATLSQDLGGTATATNVIGLNGTNLAGLATGLLKNTTGTGVPSTVSLPLSFANGGTAQSSELGSNNGQYPQIDYTDIAPGSNNVYDCLESNLSAVTGCTPISTQTAFANTYTIPANYLAADKHVLLRFNFLTSEITSGVTATFKFFNGSVGGGINVCVMQATSTLSGSRLGHIDVMLTGTSTTNSVTVDCDGVVGNSTTVGSSTVPPITLTTSSNIVVTPSVNFSNTTATNYVEQLGIMATYF